MVGFSFNAAGYAGLLTPPRATTIVLPTTLGSGHDLISFGWAEQGVSTSSGLITSVADQVGGSNWIAGAVAPSLTTDSLGYKAIDCTATGAERLKKALTLPAGVTNVTVFMVLRLIGYGASGAIFLSENGVYWFFSNDSNIYVHGAGSDIVVTNFTAARATANPVLVACYVTATGTKARIVNTTQAATGGAAAGIASGSNTWFWNTFGDSNRSYDGKTLHYLLAIYAAPTPPTSAQLDLAANPIVAFYPQ